MPTTERSLPVDASHRAFTVLVGGEPVPQAHALQAVSIVAAANRVATATLSYVDGSASEGAFALADSGLFDPGVEIQIRAGSRRDAATVFVGQVTGLQLRVREAAPPLLQVECRHGARAMTHGRHSASFTDQLDSEVIETLFGAAGLQADVPATAVRHVQLVQHDCSDWDFVIARARACGLDVLTRGGDLVLQAPQLAAPVIELRYGATLLAFDGQIDARLQAPSVEARSWNPADQAVERDEGDDPGFDPPGSFVPGDLAEAMSQAALVLPHAALLPDEAALLADASWRRLQSAQVQGRAKCIGIATVQAGDTVTLAGLGGRFDGDALVSGVRHDFDPQQGWKTHLQIGAAPPDDAHAARLHRRRAVDLLAPVAGLQCGVVTDIEDPEGEFRVRVRLPLVEEGGDGLWARLATLDAGDNRGTVFRPEVGDEVIVGFLDEDPRHPVVLGMLHSSAHAAPIPASAANALKGYRSRNGVEWQVDDDKSTMTLQTPQGNRIVLDDDAGGVTIEDQHGNRIVLDANGVSIRSATALDLQAGTTGKLEAGANLDLKGAATVAVAGAQVQLG